jgi:hypothetical protein
MSVYDIDGKIACSGGEDISSLEDILIDRLLIWHDEFTEPVLDPDKWSNVYGNYRNYTPALSGSNLYCHNFMPHERLISQVQAHYALVWDGDSTQSCVGDFGSYLQYNTPHKVSLYLRMGLPLIVWKESAMAQFVMENGVGIVADSLHSLDALLQEIDHSMWLAMRSNVEYIAQRLQKGYYMRHAVEIACRCI